MEEATHKTSTSPASLYPWFFIVSGFLAQSVLLFLKLVSFRQIPLPLILAAPLVIGACVIIARRPIHAFLLLILLLPLHTLGMSLLLTYGGVSDQMARAIAAWKEVVVLVSFTAVMVKQLYSNVNIEFTLADWLAILYLFIICMLGFVTADLHEAREPLLIRLYGMRDASFLIILYFTGRFTPIVSKDLRKILYSIYAVGIFSAVVGFFEYFFLPIQVLLVVGYVNYTNWLGTSFQGQYGLPENLYTKIGGVLVRRMFSIFLMSNVYAQCLVLIIPVVAYIRATSRRGRASMHTIVLGVTLLALFLTITRASIAASVLALFIVGYLLHDKFTRQVAGLISCAIVSAALGIVLYHPSFGLVTGSDASTANHFRIWAQSVQAIIKNPIIGMGAGTSGFASSREMVNGLDNSVGGENQYFVIGVEFGLIALLLHLGFIVAILRGSLKAFRAQSEWGRRGVCLIAFAGGVGYALNAAATSSYSVTFPTFVFWWIAGMSIQMASEGKPKQITRMTL